jgi:hypothetical protein
MAFDFYCMLQRLASWSFMSRILGKVLMNEYMYNTNTVMFVYLIMWFKI